MTTNTYTVVACDCYPFTCQIVHDNKLEETLYEPILEDDHDTVYAYWKQVSKQNLTMEQAYEFVDSWNVEEYSEFNKRVIES